VLADRLCLVPFCIRTFFDRDIAYRRLWSARPFCQTLALS
jgi:hypothetical protein